MEYAIVDIDGEPIGKERPGFARTRYGVRTYTPPKTKEYERYVRSCYMMQAHGKMLEGPIDAIITAYYGIPKSATKSARARMLDGTEACMKTPDCDNVAKSILDALNKVAYDDDKQVVSLTVRKKYSDKPHVNVKLFEISECDEPEEIDKKYIRKGIGTHIVIEAKRK